jgi:hypothetical protein
MRWPADASDRTYGRSRICWVLPLMVGVHPVGRRTLYFYSVSSHPVLYCAGLVAL